MPLTATHAPLLDLLEQKRSSNHYKVALRYFFMLEAMGQPIPAAQRSYCGAAMRRCPPRELERIRRAASDWVDFVNPPGAGACIDFEALAAEVLRLLGARAVQAEPRPPGGASATSASRKRSIGARFASSMGPLRVT